MKALIAGLRGFGLAFLIFAIPAGALAAPKYPALTGRVVDDANLLSAATEQKLDGELAALEQSTGHQLVVATVPDLQGYEIEEYGVGLLRAWGIGSKAKNDGAILIVAPSERKVRVEVGYGLEGVLTDALSSVIIHRAILPAFKAGQMEEGVVAGTEELVKQLGLPDAEARANAAAAVSAQPPAAAADSGGGWPVFLVIFVLFWVLSGVLRMFGRRRRRGGGGGLWWLLPMILSNSGRGGGSGWSGGGGGWSGGGGGGFSGGGGSGGGGGASGSW